jgi:hypothetical protein
VKSVAESSVLARLRANALESLLFVFAFAALILTIDRTLNVALRGSNADDLTFAGATGELSAMMANGTAERVGRVHRFAVPVGRTTVMVDTIIPMADSVSEPAFADGGFVHDQIVAFNDHAIRQAMLAATTRATGTRTRIPSRSLLRTVWTDEGERALSDRPNPFVLVTESPNADRQWREVRTTDWHRGPGLFAHQGEMALQVGASDSGRIGASAHRRIGEVRLNGRDCAVAAEVGDHFLYCTSPMGLDTRRFYDFRFGVTGDAANGGRFATSGSYRRRAIWVNGKSEMLGERAVVGGDIYDIPAVGPILASTADWGTVASSQWINGRRTSTSPGRGTLGFFAAAGRSAGGATAAPLVLSFDASLSEDLDRAAARFLDTSDANLARLAVVLVDVKTGEVRAIAEPARSAADEPMLSFEPVLVGSAVKPIVAAAILAEKPELAALRVSYGGDTVRAVAGIPLVKGFANAANGCTGEIDFTAFLRCSSNQYAAELLVRSLQQDGLTTSATAGERAMVPSQVLERSAIADGLASVFDVDAYAGRTPGRVSGYWKGADTATTRTDGTLHPYESRPWILFRDSDGTPVDWIARYAFGGWENRWTLLGLAQAYARIATDREVQATFLAVPPRDSSLFKPMPERATRAFALIRGALREVGTSGTAEGLGARLRAATFDGATILAKTGTLNEAGAGGQIKALAIAVGRSSSASAPLNCGLIAVTYFEFAPRTGRRLATLPRIHRDFAEGPLAEVLGRHWGRLGVCPAAVRSTSAQPEPRKR